jgi:BirA family biotin operon repressor/biotin-[acetyl-CoA-carboxylase] ligase
VTTTIQQQLLQLLTDGETHSGTALGEQLGVGRAAVWKQIQALQAMGVEIQSLPRQGYQISHPISLLDGSTIRSALATSIAERLPVIEPLWSCDSTNSELMRRLRGEYSSSGTVLLAEHQSGGRGRRGKQWVSPFGGSLYLSLQWRFSSGMMALSGLGIVVGIAMAKAIEQLGIEGVMLKWPNDLHLNDKKLGGILIELEGESEGPTDVVIGVGINVAANSLSSSEIDQPWTALSEHQSVMPSRNQLAALLLSQLIPRLDHFEQQGLGGLMSEWDALDRIRDCPVWIDQEGARESGVARGITAIGALQVELNGGLCTYYSGDVSLRLR